ncbi:extracellular solute-binding protein [Acaryochloris sp. IP29b_bin.137]|uniref:extracellular solute-binding protein n=1 Tax=Acaryochloris sp. IP29b_bin.137 TaxID=2969217 RepID=UPI002605CFBE|nr:extracellular solute-binding protein [Acaryochloris sp. IP29b_bin.137]
MKKHYWWVGGVAVLQILILGLLYFNWPPMVLTLLVPESEKPAWQSLITLFEAQHPKTKIQLITAKNLGGFLTKQLKEGTCLPKGSPDIVYLDVIWVPEFAVRGCLQDLSKRFVPKMKSQFSPQAVRDGEYLGKSYRIPFRSDMGMLYYRSDLLNQAGYQHPPETFTELIEISKTLKQKQLVEWGFLWQGDQYEGKIATFVEVLRGHGGYWIDEKTRQVGLDQPQAIQAVQFLRTTLKSKVSPANVLTFSEDESLAQFRAGKSIFLRHWPRARSFLADDNNGAVKAVPMQLHTPAHQGGPCNGSWGLGIAKKTQHADRAWKAIQFFTSEQAQRQFTQETQFVPSHKAVLKQDSPEIQQAITKAIFRPRIPEYDQASEILQAALSQALNPDTSDQEAQSIMKTAAQETRQLLNPPS